MTPSDLIARYGALHVHTSTGSIVVPLTGDPAYDAKLERFAALDGHTVTRAAPGTTPAPRRTEDLPDDPPF